MSKEWMIMNEVIKDVKKIVDSKGHKDKESARIKALETVNAALEHLKCECKECLEEK